MSRPNNVVHVVEKRVRACRPPGDVFHFFDRPVNLKRVTPSSLAVTLERHPADLRPGSIFGYRLRQWPVDLSWEVVVSEYRPPRGFTNVKSTGYFPKWALTHAFEPRGRGETELRLRLEYEVPSGLYAFLTNRHVIRAAMDELVTEQIRAVRQALERGR